jgi:hypothetical protein
MDILDIVKALGPLDRCGAKTRSGEPCKNAKMHPAGRCRMHGGKSYRGVASPRYVHGRYSKELLARLAGAIAAEAAEMRGPALVAPQAVESVADYSELFATLDLDGLIAYWSSPEAQAAGQAALDEILSTPIDLFRQEDTHVR